MKSKSIEFQSKQFQDVTNWQRAMWITWLQAFIKIFKAIIKSSDVQTSFAVKFRKTQLSKLNYLWSVEKSQMCYISTENNNTDNQLVTRQLAKVTQNQKKSHIFASFFPAKFRNKGYKLYGFRHKTLKTSNFQVSRMSGHPARWLPRKYPWDWLDSCFVSNLVFLMSSPLQLLRKTLFVVSLRPHWLVSL